MSRTFSLVCHETKQSLWIGQARTGEPERMAFVYGLEEEIGQLKRFLLETQGKPLVVIDDEGLDYAEFEETEEDSK